MYNYLNTIKPFFFRKALCFCAILLSFCCLSQKEENYIIVDENYALDFNHGINPKIDTAYFGDFYTAPIKFKGFLPFPLISSICDTSGKLLFYTDGSYIWDKNRQIMPNGTLAGHNNSIHKPWEPLQAHAIIVPNSYNSNQYYLIVTDYLRRLNTYSLVDLSLNNGNGDIITTKKMKTFTGDNFFHIFKAIGTDSCNGTWLISANSSIGFCAYKIGIEGVNINPIISYSKFPNKGVGVVSNDGKLVITYSDKYYDNIININAFNSKTGYIEFNPIYSIGQNVLSLTGIQDSYYQNFGSSYISENKKYIGISSPYFSIDGENKSVIFSLNLNPLQGELTIKAIDSLSWNGGSLVRLAPNGKMYAGFKKVTYDYQTEEYTVLTNGLAVFNDLNQIGSGLGYNFNSIKFPDDARPNLPYQGLVNYYGRPKPRPRITLPTQQICSQTPFSLSADVSNLPQVQSGKQIWYLNDTEVISYNPNDQYTINEPGVYKLSFRHEECIEHTTITVTAPPVHNIPPKDSLCEGKFLQLTSTGILQIKNQLNLPISPPVSVAGNYTFTVLGCSSLSGSFGLSVTQKPNLILPNTLAGCLTLGVVLQPLFITSLGQNLLWSNGSTIPYQTITTSGIFTITVSNRCFTEQKSTQISLLSKPILPKFPSDTTICENKNITILGNQNLVATEQISNKIFFSNNNILIITQAGVYTISQSNACYTSTGVLGISEILKPNLALPNTLAGCLPLGVQLQPVFNSTLGQNLLWSNGSTIPYQTITTSGIFTITVSNRCFAEQKSTQISLLSKSILPKFAPDTTVCEGKNITILGNQNMVATEQSSNKTYFSNNNILTFTQAGIYTISQSNACHTTTSNIVIKTDNFPVFTLPKDTIICDSTSFSFLAIRNKSANTSLIWKDGSTENYRSISQPGNYEITVKNSCGEFKKAFNITFASSKIGFKGTNIFTPNGDNSNDEWQPTTESSEAYKLEIFNRQGTKVFQSEQWNESWQAQSQPDGIYFYHISYLDCNQQTKSLKGWVEVRR